MTTQEIMALVNAGFTKADIMQLAGAGAKTDAESQTEAQQIVPTVAQPIENTQTEVATPIPEQQKAKDTVTMSDAQFTQLMQTINSNGASLDVPPKYDIKNVLGEHFKDIMIGG